MNDHPSLKIQASAQDQEDDVTKTTHIFLGLCVALCLSFFIWASIGKLDIVSMATGEVIPSTQVKSIQHLEGGIVRKIAV
jgi:adhesin transport system membrane fusion protein